MQEEVGLQSATDGEFRRASWHMDFIYELEGISKAEDDLVVHFHNPDGDIDYTPAALKVDGRIDLHKPTFGDDFQFLSETVTSATPKLTIPSPSMVHYRGGAAAIDPAVYPDKDQFWTDLTSAYAKQVQMVFDLGCTYLQFDDTSLAYLNDPNQRKMMSERGEDAEHLHEAYIRHINEALAGKPDGITITTHMCRGNFRSWVAEGGYDFVAEAPASWAWTASSSSTTTRARAASSRCASCQARAGLVTTKRGELEDKDELKRRIEEASSTWTSTSSACRCGSRRRPRATTSPTTSRSPSCADRRGGRGVGLSDRFDVSGLRTVWHGRGLGPRWPR